MNIAIVTDSNSGITPALAKELGVTVIPMPFLIDGEEYFEGINLTQEEFYEKLLQDATVSTSQPNVYDVTDLWRELLKTHKEVVYIPMSSGLSGSCETATNFSKEFNGKVQVIDNKRISITQKQSVLDALNLAKQGKSAKEIKNRLEDTALNCSIYIMVNTLKYLKKGGRLTPAVAAIGSLLKIKPVLQIQGDKLDNFCKVMTVKQGKKSMLDQVVKDINTRFGDLVKAGKMQISMAYTKDLTKCLEFKEEANKVLAEYGLSVHEVDPLSLSVSCHIGDGAIAIACIYKD